MYKIKKFSLATSLLFLLSGCGEESPKIIHIKDGVAQFRNVDHNLNVTFNIPGDLTVHFFENYAKIEAKNNVEHTIHYVPLDKIVYIGSPILVN
ncbi:hypothetical protein BCU91_14060 [Shewanella sp. 10N.286.52.B9]|nr:hypothetical protein BCU91_14060 [Shewanella sp. 10N.286.52.B9]